ncbi:ABC transporter permease [Thermogladius sp. 4427co]|uniref:ABC transporter permease n=1 Tax=Thermogladius sp. 4427co TaxID=3450718 RepID=UPI003F7A4153
MDPSMIYQLIVQTINATTPLLLAATGEIIGERAGIANIGLEGIMLITAFMAVLADVFIGGPLWGVLVAVAVGIVLGVIHGTIAAYLKGDQIVDGVGLNLFALGFVAYSIIAFFHVAGYYTISWDKAVPKFYGISPIAVLAIIVAVLSYWLLFKTQTGLAIRSCGENPEAADSVGIHVERIQLYSSMIVGALTGLAGAFLSIDWNASITKQISAGRGFIALAIVNFANWNPLLGLAGSFLFGFFWVVGEWIKNIGWLKAIIPVELINTVPYAATLIVVAGVIGRSRPPRYVGVPYKRE